MDLTGASCGLFEVWGRIGEGGMSHVWLARHRELHTPVVIKTLRETDGLDDAFERLRNEARLTARIPSPKVVRAVDVGVHDGLPYLVQEYVDGIDLAELDRARRRALGRGLPLWFVCNVARDIADALHSAHQTGVFHRDVKPSNLFESPQTGIRLGDFGIAIARRSEREGVATGTLRFVAPEVLRGCRPTRRCDVYSLGATAYDLYYGRPPFDTAAEILGDKPPPFPRARTAEEAYFQHVLSRMLERDPERRVPSTAQPRHLFASLARTLSPPLPTIPLAPGQFQLGPVRVSCEQGDIAEVVADGIVNSANDEMRMASGVGLALRRKGGQIIEDEAMRDGSRALGECIATTAGALSCRYVLHAVSAWREASCIARTCQRALLLAEALALRTLAIPALGTGAARVSSEACAYAAASALLAHVLLGGSRLREVRFVLYDRDTYDVFVEQLSGVFLGDVEADEGHAGLAEDSSTVDCDATLWLPPSRPPETV